jgi:hypothetical protein
MCSVSDEARKNDEYSSDDEYQLGSLLRSDFSQESIKLGDTINYWLSISVWGEPSTMRYGKVVKVITANEIYQPHIYLDNGDTVYWGDAIRKVEETSDVLSQNNS